MKTNDTTQPAVKMADPASPKGITQKEQNVLDVSVIQNRIMKSGAYEVLFGFWIILATLGMFGVVNHIAFLSTSLRYLHWIVIFTYLLSYYYQYYSLRKGFPDVKKKTIEYSLNTSLFYIAILPWLICIAMVLIQLDKLDFVIPRYIGLVISMMLATGFFSGVFLVWFSRYTIWRILVWAVLTFAVLVLLGFEIINLSNFYLFYLPLGTIILLAGLIVILRRKASV